MKRIVTFCTLLSSTALVGEVLAATGNREDSSGLLVWAFLAFCALIILAQLFPAMMMIFGFRKGMKKPAEEATEKVG